MGPEIGRDSQGFQLLPNNTDRRGPTPGEGSQSVVVVGLPFIKGGEWDFICFLGIWHTSRWQGADPDFHLEPMTKKSLIQDMQHEFWFHTGSPRRLHGGNHKTARQGRMQRDGERRERRKREGKERGEEGKGGGGGERENSQNKIAN